MRVFEALDYLEEKANAAKTREVKITLNEVYEVLLRAGANYDVRWAKKIEQIVEYVEANNIYVGCRPDAVKLLNKRKYGLPSSVKSE
jgi:uncharacterized protein (UPF0297 family)